MHKTCLSGDRAQQVAVPGNGAASNVHNHHFARAEALSLNDLLRVEVRNAGFGSGHHPTVGSSRGTHRTKAVAVKLGADDAAITEDQRGWTIPRFVFAGTG